MSTRRGLARAAQRFAGGDPAAVCATLQRWRERGDRELPWLAGPALGAVNSVGVAPPRGEDITIVERFLIGAETDEQRLVDAITGLDLEVGGTELASLPPDARGALGHAVDRFFELLADAYAALHVEVRAGHRRTVEALLDEWQPRLDDAAEEIEFRAQRLAGTTPPPAPRPPRRQRDRAGLAFAFVLLALIVAAVMMWLVLQGWPMESVDFGV